MLTKTKPFQIFSSWDDGSKYDIGLADLLDRYEIPATFFLPVLWKDLAVQKGWEPLTDEEADSIADRFEIGSHGVTHRYLTKIDFKEACSEIIDSKKALQSRFNRPIEAFCYPRGYANKDLKAIVNNHYTWARNTGIGNIRSNEDRAWTTPTVHVYNRSEYGDLDWLSYARLQLKRVREQGGIFHLWGHSWEIERDNVWDDLEKLFIEMQL